MTNWIYILDEVRNVCLDCFTLSVISICAFYILTLLVLKVTDEIHVSHLSGLQMD